MTIALAVNVHDGIVLATDSAASMVSTNSAGQQMFQNVYNNANKLFNLVKGLPIGGMVWGTGSIGSASISTIIKDLRRLIYGTFIVGEKWYLNSVNFQIEGVATLVAEYFRERVAANPTSKPSGGFLVSGYSSGGELAECWQIDFKAGVVGDPIRVPVGFPPDAAYCISYAQNEAITRLLYGIPNGLGAALRERSVPDHEIGDWLNTVAKHSNASLISQAMPIQDAIDLVEFLAYVCVQYTRFAPGPASVGGPIDVAAITKHEGFKWIKRKYHFSREYNPKE